MKVSANWPGDVIPQTISFVIESCVFGVYGMLGMALMLFCLRALRTERAWKDKPLAISFWSINMITIGLVLMVVLSLLPVGIRRHGLQRSTVPGMRARRSFCRRGP